MPDRVFDVRVLGRVRISKASEESTSIERQQELIEGWAKGNDHEIIGWATDENISGGVDPFDTAGLGPWLKEPRMHDWDILVAWKLDRISRRAISMNKLFGWFIDNDKTIVSTSEGIDLSTHVGRLIASVLGFLAEGELEALKERTRGSQKKLRELGRWRGGKPLYGFKAVERQGKDAGWELVLDEHASKVLLGVIDKVLDGQSTASIARELNESGELSPSDYLRQRAGNPIKGSSWSSVTIRKSLRSKTLIGHSTHQGKTVRDADGMPVLAGPELISPEKFERVQAALDSKGFKVTNRSAKASPLLGVGYCGWCGRLMHLRQHHKKSRGKTYRYYQCVGGASSGGGGHLPDHEPNIIKADELETAVEFMFLAAYGAEMVKEKVLVPGSDHQKEIDERVRAAEDYAEMLETAASDAMRKHYRSKLEANDRRIAELEKLPVVTAGWKWLASDQTYSDAWEAADTEAKRQLLLKRRVSASVVAGPVIHLYAEDVEPGQGTRGEVLAGLKEMGIRGVEADIVEGAYQIRSVHLVDGRKFEGEMLERILEDSVLTEEQEAQAAEFYGWNRDPDE